MKNTTHKQNAEYKITKSKSFQNTKNETFFNEKIKELEPKYIKILNEIILKKKLNEANQNGRPRK